MNATAKGRKHLYLPYIQEDTQILHQPICFQAQNISQVVYRSDQGKPKSVHYQLKTNDNEDISSVVRLHSKIHVICRNVYHYYLERSGFMHWFSLYHVKATLNFFFSLNRRNHYSTTENAYPAKSQLPKEHNTKS